MTTLPSLLIVGCGHMGKAMLKGWLKKGLAPSYIVNRSKFEVPAPHKLVSSLQEVPHDFKPDAIILAIRPHQAEALIPDLTPWVKDTPVLSVLGGKNLTWLAKQFGANHPNVQIMPNTPSELGLGMTLLVANDAVTEQQKKMTETLFTAIGKIAWLNSEKQMDFACSISGCGPAYIFLLAELLEKIGAENGLPKDIAKLMARQTVIGSAALLGHSHEESETLRKAVATPNGITEQAINVLNHPDAWPAILSQALQAAAKRSRELST